MKLSKARNEENWSRVTYLLTLFIMGLLMVGATGNPFNGFIFAVIGAAFISRWRPHLFPSALDRAAARGVKRLTRTFGTLLRV